ncbi:MAG TPA: tetratricopeptide repeat protein [Gammaproteobacteria bacterium]|nr:tetratricopeptide repeat protein [Gammaproteobacteria bacterium]
MIARRLMLAALCLCALLGITAAARADTTLNQGSISTTLFRKMRTVQNMIRGGQYGEAQNQLGYLQGVATSAYETAVVRELFADLYIARGDYSAALSALQPVVQQGILPPSEQRNAELALAKLQVGNGQYQAGLDTLRSWLQGQDTTQPDALITLAQAYGQLGQCRQAIPYAKRAVEATGEPPQEWFQLWIACQYDVHDYVGAAEALSAALSRYPDQAQYWQQLGEAYAQSGDDSKALAVYALMYRQGLIRQAQDYLTLASLYMRNGIPYQAAQVLQEGLTSGVLPVTDANYTLLASAWQQAGDTEREVAALTEAVKAAKTGDPYLAQAQVYAGRHEWLAVIDAGKKAIAKGSLRRPGRAWLLVGVAEVQNRQYDDGATALREAIKYDDTRAQAEAWLRYLNGRGVG